MSKASLAESLLARLTDRARAAAMMGDLDEIASTRGRLWFLTAYMRTLFSLAWRTPVAFFVGFVAIRLVIRAIEYWIMHTPLAWRTAFAIGPLMSIVTLILWFIFPFGLIRYGWRDKFVQLACANTVLASVIFFYPPVLNPISASVFTVVALLSLISPVWRRAAIVLVSSVTAGSVAIAAISFAVAMTTIFISEQLHPDRLFKNQTAGVGTELACLLILATVCSRLHARLLRSNSAGVVDA